MKDRQEFNDVASEREFKQVMRKHPDFEESEFYKVDRAYTHFLEARLIRPEM